MIDPTTPIPRIHILLFSNKLVVSWSRTADFGKRFWIEDGTVFGGIACLNIAECVHTNGYGSERAVHARPFHAPLRRALRPPGHFSHRDGVTSAFSGIIPTTSMPARRHCRPLCWTRFAVRDVTETRLFLNRVRLSVRSTVRTCLPADGCE